MIQEINSLDQNIQASFLHGLRMEIYHLELRTMPPAIFKRNTGQMSQQKSTLMNYSGETSIGTGA